MTRCAIHASGEWNVGSRFAQRTGGGVRAVVANVATLARNRGMIKQARRGKRIRRRSMTRTAINSRQGWNMARGFSCSTNPGIGTTVTCVAALASNNRVIEQSRC
jgi:hypothetical protein